MVHLKRTLSFLAILLFIAPVYGVKETGTLADISIGQPDLNTSISVKNGLAYPTAMLVVNGRLYIADYVAHRIVGYNTFPSAFHTQNDFTIGQFNPSFADANAGGLSDNSLWYPTDIATDGTHFAIADTANHRVLIYDHIPTSNSDHPSVILGQPNATSHLPNHGGISGRTFYNPTGVYFYQGKLLVADSMNNRVLIWNTIPSENFAYANVVIGQNSMSSGSSGFSNRSLNNPTRIIVANGKLLISDSNNNRVLIYNSIPTQDYSSADTIIGQPDTASYAENNGGVSAKSLDYPTGLAFNGTKLAIADTDNHRILIYNEIPTENFAAANFVVGQPDMSQNTMFNGGYNGNSLRSPEGVYFYGEKLLIGATISHMVMIYNSVPTDNYAIADYAIGTSSFTPRFLNDSSSDTFFDAYHYVYNGKLIVSDKTNNRVLIWNTIPSTGSELNPDIVLGQPDINSNLANNGGISAHGLNMPGRAVVCGGKLIVPDYMNRRVLIWNTIPTQNNQDANVVIGQPDMTSSTRNNGGVSDKSLYVASDVECANGKLLVTDLGNNRVLLFNTIPTENFTAANVVIGQPDFSSSSANNGGRSNRSLYYPTSTTFDGTRLLIADSSNNRMLIFNTLPEANYDDADFVLGQANFSGGSANAGGSVSSSSMSSPSFAYVDGARLFVADSGNNRVLGWRLFPTQNNQQADFVIGQTNFTTNVENSDRSSRAYNLINPSSISTYNNTLYISDIQNSRILGYTLSPSEMAVSIPDYTNNRAVNVSVDTSEVMSVLLSEDEDFVGSEWMSSAISMSISLSEGVGQKTLYYKLLDYAGYESQTFTHQIDYVTDSDSPYNLGIIINSGQQITNNRMINLSLAATDNTSAVRGMMISENQDFEAAAWVDFNTDCTFQLSQGEGEKTIYAKFRDYFYNESETVFAKILYDQTPPTLVINTTTIHSFTGVYRQLEVDVHEDLTAIKNLQWSEVGTNGVVIESPAADQTMIYSNSPGTYTIRLTASDTANNEVENNIVFINHRRGDCNNDAFIDEVDLSYIAYYWKTASQASDFNGDGVVDEIDLSYLAYYWRT